MSNRIPRQNATYKKVLAAFQSKFPGGPGAGQLVESFAPGRINLIGEHVDYMGGDVVPAAVNLGVCFIARLGSSPAPVQFYSVNNKETDGGWAVYLKGILEETQALLGPNRRLPSMQVAFGGDVPIGSGMSSSAALCVGFLALLREAFGLASALPDLPLASLARQIEVRYAKVNIGIMDQYISVFGKEGKFLRLNCDTLTHETHDFASKITNKGYSVILVNSMVKHKLGDDYNQIRNAMETCERVLGKKLITASEDEMKTIEGKVTAEQYARGMYVVTEVARTNHFVKATEPKVLGALLNATHHGLSKALKVSTEQLDFIQEAAMTFEGAAGARVMGGGFGGCVLALVQTPLLDKYEFFVKHAFKAKFGLVPEVYRVAIGGGACAEKRTVSKL